MNFHFSVVLATSHAFRYVVFPFLFSSMFFFSLKTFSVTHALFRSGLITFQVCRYFYVIFFLFTSSLILMWSENTFLCNFNSLKSFEACFVGQNMVTLGC